MRYGFVIDNKNDYNLACAIDLRVSKKTFESVKGMLFIISSGDDNKTLVFEDKADRLYKIGKKKPKTLVPISKK